MMSKTSTLAFWNEINDKRCLSNVFEEGTTDVKISLLHPLDVLKMDQKVIFLFKSIENYFILTVCEGSSKSDYCPQFRLCDTLRSNYLGFCFCFT